MSSIVACLLQIALIKIIYAMRVWRLRFWFENESDMRWYFCCRYSLWARFNLLALLIGEHRLCFKFSITFLFFNDSPSLSTFHLRYLQLLPLNFRCVDIKHWWYVAVFLSMLALHWHTFALTAIKSNDRYNQSMPRRELKHWQVHIKQGLRSLKK